MSLALQRAADQIAEVTTAGFINSPDALDRLATLGVKLDPEEHPLDLPAAHLRLAQLSQVFAQDRQLVLLDEPDVGLDNTCRSIVHTLIAEALTNGQAVIMTCHDETFAAEVGDYATLQELWLRA